MSKRAKPQSVQIRAVSWHDSVLPQPLKFAPPYAHLAADSKGFSRFWQFASYAFGLPDPNKFPPYPGPIDGKDRTTISRYVQSCREIATYSVMSAHDSVTFHDTGASSSHSAVFSSSEAIRGTSVLFRQLYGTDSGSYRSVASIIGRLQAQRVDEFTDLRADVLRDWRRAHAALGQQRIEAIVGRMAANIYAGTTSRAPVPFEDERPAELISMFLYGDLIHWGDKRDVHAALQRDPLMADLTKLHFLEAMSGLAHYYLGFSIVAARAIGLPPDHDS